MKLYAWVCITLDIYLYTLKVEIVVGSQSREFFSGIKSRERAIFSFQSVQKFMELLRNFEAGCGMKFKECRGSGRKMASL